MRASEQHLRHFPVWDGILWNTSDQVNPVRLGNARATDPGVLPVIEENSVPASDVDNHVLNERQSMAHDIVDK
jgi:hypothetical protein